ncbi:hypothetical protein GCM10009753_40680 [Streptantibioticus ferralitis]|uniref:Uncharacterized protein n=1 Tax=Streptantibioticus ferralitis TaxID=236510 RepID=A0ABT5YU39_9ACTN|nr:hypothetical protein [Streptantibioticus ferralitis]MDF2255132.1 hypothetical protein [Streptantibioticus ferralitis]
MPVAFLADEQAEAYGKFAEEPTGPVSVLARQAAEVRSIAEQRTSATVANAARRADPSLPGDLIALLDVPEGKRLSELERMRRPPTRTT